MQLVDSHAHLDFEDFHGDFDQVILRAKQSGVEKIINIGASLERSRASVTLAENYKNIFAVIGVHPEESEKINFDTIHDELLEIAKSSKKVVGIGETGLDYYFPSTPSSPTSHIKSNPVDRGSNFVEDKIPVFTGMTKDIKKKQIRLFETHIDVARHFGLPLVIHIRNGDDEEAVNEVYETLKKTSYCKGVIHCFTLDSAWAKRFTDLGFFLGFTGIITYKNAKSIRGAVSATPLEKILIETDCPFLAPQKYRGKRNEPAYVVEVAEEIAKIKEITVAKVAEQTTMNVIELFSI